MVDRHVSERDSAGGRHGCVRNFYRGYGGGRDGCVTRRGCEDSTAAGYDCRDGCYKGLDIACQVGCTCPYRVATVGGDGPLVGPGLGALGGLPGSAVVCADLDTGYAAVVIVGCAADREGTGGDHLALGRAGDSRFGGIRIEHRVVVESIDLKTKSLIVTAIDADLLSAVYGAGEIVNTPHAAKARGTGCAQLVHGPRGNYD